MKGTEPGTILSEKQSNLEKLVLDLDHASKELLLVQHKLPQGPMRLAASAYACMAAHLRSGVEDLRQSLEGAGVSAALSTGTPAPSTSPGLVYFEELTREGNLLVPLGVRHQLELPTGGWLAFFPGTDGQIHVLSKRKYRERFGGGLDDG